MIDKAKELVNRHAELETLMSSPEIAADPSAMEKLGREHTSLGKNIPLLTEYIDTVDRLEQANALLKSETDEGMLELAREEVREIEEALPDLNDKIRRLLVPKDPNDAKNAIMEIRAGTGGAEAAIFAADLYRMYTYFIEAKGWKAEVLSSSFGELNGIKEIIFSIEGPEAYGALKFESGVHRVQRVPVTETQGRIHTSAASVAVFPEADEFELQIDPSELRIDVYRAGGHGGQHVNKTESAVRIVHIPTGMTATCQDEKSQHKNKAKAMKVLQSRLYERMLEEQNTKESASRKSMVGSGDRSEKIRTYNFPQNRVTDHRINYTSHRLDEILNGAMQDLCDALLEADINARVSKIEQASAS